MIVSDHNPSSSSASARNTRELSCTHYSRWVSPVDPLSGRTTPCRICHEERCGEPLARREIRLMQCRFCRVVQSAQSACANPSCTQHGISHRYYCSVCHLWENNPAREIFHCDACGICRVGKASMYRHCDRCNMCVPRNSEHRCWGVAKECPICFQDLHSSNECCVYTRCGHILHKECFNEWCAHGRFKCPVCMQSLYDDTTAGENILLNIMALRPQEVSGDDQEADTTTDFDTSGQD